MQFRNLALAFAISTIGLAQDIDNDEVPPQCQSVCSSIVTLARDCDNTTNDDNAELRCLCNGSNASTLVPLCAACISQNGDRDNGKSFPHVKSHVVDIMTSCSFSRTTWVSSAAATVLSSVSSQSQSQSQSGSSPATTPVTTTASATQSSDSASATAGAQTSSTGGAPAQTVAAVAGLGALGLALML